MKKSESDSNLARNAMGLLLIFGIVVSSLLFLAGCGQQGKGPRVITEEFLPYNFRTPDGMIGGASTEVVNGIMERTGEKADIEFMNFTEGYNIALKEPNVALYSVARTPEREGLFKWVGP